MKGRRALSPDELELEERPTARLSKSESSDGHMLTVFGEDEGEDIPDTPSTRGGGFLAQAIRSLFPRRRQAPPPVPSLVRRSGMSDAAGPTLSSFWKWESSHAKLIQGLPLQLPLWTGLAAIWWQVAFFGLSGPNDSPFLPWLALNGCIYFGFIYIAATMLEDLRLARLKLLFPQKAWVGCMILLVGATGFMLRLLYITVPNSSTGTELSTELAQRFIYGVPFWLSRFVGLDMFGFGVGFVAFQVFFYFGLAACFCFNGCGRTRAVQRMLRLRRRDPVPFMDMVTNREQLTQLNPLMFLYPFCIISSVVLGGTLLIEPSRVFAPAGAPTRLQPLCSPAFTTSLYARARSFVTAASDASVPLSPSVATALLDLAWARSFEPIDTQCDPDGGPVAALPLPVGGGVLALPRLAVALRDDRGEAATLVECGEPCRSHPIVATLLASPPGCMSSSGGGGGGGGGGGAGVALGGLRSSRLGDAGVANFSSLTLDVAHDACAGDFTVRLALPSEALPLSVDLTLRLVSAANQLPTETSFDIAMPAFTDPLRRNRTTALVSYHEAGTADTVVTTVSTNTTMRWETSDGASGVETSLEVKVLERPATHLLAFTGRPPETVTLRTPFNLSVTAMTETGIPLVGEQIQALLLAPLGSGARFAPNAVGYTDARGAATLTLSMERGSAGTYPILLGSGGTLDATLKKDVGVVLEGVRAALTTWENFVVPLYNDAAALAALAQNGTLQRLVQSAVQKAVVKEVGKAVEDLESCLELAAAVEAAAAKEQNASVTLDMSGVPQDGDLAALLESLAVGTFSFSMLDELGAAEVTSLACYQSLAAAAAESPRVAQDPKGVGREVAQSLMRSVLEELGMTLLVETVLALGQQSDVAALASRLNPTLDQGQAAAAAVLDAVGDGEGGVDWRRALSWLVLTTLGQGAPPIQLIRIDNSVASVEQTAPLAGQGVFTTANPDPLLNQQANGISAARCVVDGHPQFLPPMDATPLPRLTAADVVRLSTNTRPSGDGGLGVRTNPTIPFATAAPLWQPALFASFNWLLDPASFADRELYVSGSSLPHLSLASPLCHATFLAEGQPAPGTVPLDAGGNGTLLVPDAMFNGHADVAAWLEGLDGNGTAFAARCDGDKSWERACKYAELLGFDARRHDNALYFSASPRLIVRDADGEPLAGRYCTIREEGGGASSDLLSLSLEYACGPSDERGVIAIERLSARGGGTRELRLVVDVDGVVAVPAPRSFWRRENATAPAADAFASHLRYYVAHQPTFSMLNFVMLQGHDSLRLLAILAMPVFALNGVGLRGQPPRLLYRAVAAVAWIYFLYVSLSLLSRWVGPRGTDWEAARATHLLAFGMADMVPLRAHAAGRDPLLTLLMVISAALTMWLTVLVTWLLVGAELTNHPRARAAFEHVIGRLGAVTAALRPKSRRRTGPGDEPPPSEEGRPVDGSLEPDLPFWKENSSERRLRWARNHVRKLLRGRRWQQTQVANRGGCCHSKDNKNAPYKGRGSFIFPQRLWMAFALSIWSQLLITLVFHNLIEWVAVALGAAQQFDEQLQTESQYHAAVAATSRYPPLFRALLALVWLFLAPNGRASIFKTALQVTLTPAPTLT